MPLRPQAPSFRVFALSKGPGVEHELKAGEVDAYEMDLVADQYLYASFDQHGIDIVVHVFGPGHRQLFEVDRLYEAEGAERVHLIADTPGRYRLEVGCSQHAHPGHYLARLEALRPATETDRLRVKAERAFYDARGWEGQAPEFWEAVAKFELSLRLFQQLGAKDRQAEAFYRLGKRYLGPHLLPEALDLYLSANALYRDLNDRPMIALSYNQIGWCYHHIGDLDRAFSAYRLALAEWQRQAPAPAEAGTMANLAELHAFRGEATEAIRLYRQAADLSARCGDTAREADALTHLGWVYRSVGDWEEALIALRRARRLARQGPAWQRSATLNEVGQVFLDDDEPRRALPYFEKALAESREQHARDEEIRQKEVDVGATTLTDLGLCYLQLGEFSKSVAPYQRALEIYRSVGQPEHEANALIDLGSAYRHLQQPLRAQECFAAALHLARATGYRTTEATALLGAAATARDQRNLGRALRDGEAALERVEALRAGASRADLQSSFLALNENHYGFVIDVLMQLHAREPGRGFDLKAFGHSEQSRARSLLDDLLARRAAPASASSVGQAVLAQLRGLQQQIAAKDREVRQPPSAEPGAPPRAAALADLERLLEQRREFFDRIRKADPRSAILSSALPRSSGDLPRQLLDDQTVLLEYYLDTPKSFLWAVTSDSFASFELPGSDELEPLLRSIYLQQSRTGPEANSELASMQASRLSRILLGQVADRLGERRLLIVANGALQYIPFAALPDPRDLARPLMVRHEIVYAPSLAALAALRTSHDSRPRPPGVVAILADPVFGAADERAVRFKIPPTMLDPLLSSLPRLPYSRAEADAIAAVAGRQGVLEALGFDASPDLVTSGRLSRYRILHFATHGTLRADKPDLSALALSQLDAAGRPRNGVLYASEIKYQDLPADLVVLSGCGTALGKELGGEGLVGLPQSFMSAGARRVLVSLWDVGDRSTAELMSHFYHSLLEDKLPPAAALRAAQLSMWSDAASRAPYYWGGFVLQGDWR